MVRFKWEVNFKESEIGMLKTDGIVHYIFGHGVCGKIPKDWKVKRINEDYNVNTGERVSPTNEGLFPVFGANGFSGYSHNFLIDKKAIITGRVGTLGQVYRVDGKVNVSDNALYITKKREEAVIDFLYYALKLIFSNIEEVLNVGTTQPLIKQSEVQKFSIPFPEYKEQERIATVLSWFDDLIENKRRQNEVLEKVAMAVFKSWFVDFEPFRDGEFVPSELGEIPKGWTVKPIGELAEIRNGLSYSGKEKFEEPVEGSYIFITLNNAIEGGGFKPVYAWIKSDRIKEHHFLEEGDLIIPNTEQTKDERLLGSPGIVFFPPDYKKDKGVYSMDIVRIAPKDGYYKFYLYLYLMFTREESASFNSGTNVLHFDIQNFKKNKLVPCPPTPILEKFHSLVEPLFRKVILNQKQIMVLRKVRDTLLPLLVFGKLRVEEL
ncbi:MAG: restriction endonuclease subunit S [Candidatus Bathyarchaeia archaeon]